MEMPSEEVSQKFMFGGTFLRRLVAWANALKYRWEEDLPADLTKEIGITTAELLINFIVATKTRPPINLNPRLDRNAARKDQWELPDLHDGARMVMTYLSWEGDCAVWQDAQEG